MASLSITEHIEVECFFEPKLYVGSINDISILIQYNVIKKFDRYLQTQ